MKSKLTVLIIFIFALGAISGFAISNINQKTPDLKTECSGKYSYINPNLGCETNYVIKKTGYVDLKHEVEKYISQQKSEGKILEASVYFRDLINGPWMGIEEGNTFTPASLLKLPLMITYLKIAEENPQTLTKKLKIIQLPKDSQQYFKPEKTIEIGQTYTLEDLIRRMIIYSDNRSSGFLIEYLLQAYKNSDKYITTLREVGIIRSEANPYDYISVKDYASLFRQLFNTSYLSLEMSEKALEILSETKFKEGIVGGIPENIKIAHKFGERKDTDNKYIQLHDCGIVYFPQNPYLICVMTRGDNLDELSEVISEISEMVYKEVDSRKL